MRRNTICNFSRLILVIIFALLFVACGGSNAEEPTEEPTATEAATDEEEEAATDEEEEAVSNEDPCYIPNQILLMGNQQEVEDIAGSIGLVSEPVESYRLDYLDKFLENREDEIPRPDLLPDFSGESGYANLVINLYETADSDLISLLAEVHGMTNTVFADLNYKFGLEYPTMGGLSWMSTGSPAFTTPQALTDNGQDRFNQWALDVIDNASSDNNGKGVLIGVFDAFPNYPTEPEYALSTPTGSQNISDHGAFVKELVRLVAEESDIHEYTVLNEYGQGPLNLLIRRLIEFSTEFAGSNFASAVINLSLGLHPDCEMEVDESINTLNNLLSSSYRTNVTILAAAGNDGKGEAEQIPANYWYVIGVGASNFDNETACFSNNSDVLAPGGGKDEKLGCVPAIDQCLGDPQCPYGLISHLPSLGGYGYWAGTSFATPLASGMAAQILSQEGGTFKEVFDTTGGYMTQTIWDAISCSSQGTGVINLYSAFDDCIQLVGAIPLPLQIRTNDDYYDININDSSASLQNVIITDMWNGTELTLRFIDTETHQEFFIAPNSHSRDFEGRLLIGLMNGSIIVDLDGAPESAIEAKFLIFWEQQ